MRLRKKGVGNSNLIGANVQKIRKEKEIKQKELLAQLQVKGIDMNASALSKLEGQTRIATDIETLALSEVLNVPISTLFEKDK